MKNVLKWLILLLPIITLLFALVTGYALFLMPIFPVIALVTLVTKGLVNLSNKLFHEEIRPFKKWTVIVLVTYLVIGSGGTLILFLLTKMSEL